MSKTIRVANAVEAIPEGSTLMIGGFIGVGSPVRLIDELVRQGKTGLTIIANDTASSPWSMRASNFASEFQLSRSLVDTAQLSKFYQTVLGFSLSDIVVDDQHNMGTPFMDEVPLP
jgi:acyl CoA:acetate/3-ketoacid CoA transferase